MRRAGAIGRTVFWPAPNVDSGLVAWERRPEPPTTTVPRERVFAVVDAAFAQRRKALRGALRGLAGSGEAATAALERAGVDPMARGEQLDLAAYVAVAEALQAGEPAQPSGEGSSSAAGPVEPGARGPVVVRAPAKVNLHLGVGAPREDGFHPLVTVYQAIGLYDDVTALDLDAQGRPPAGPAVGGVEPGRPAAGVRLSLTTEEHVSAADVPLDATNIAAAAARALADHHDLGPGALDSLVLHVAKAVPVAGGLAGGSADAAAALVALDRLRDLGTSDDDLLALAAELGSDVPFALLGGSALGTGRGELVEPVTDAGGWWWVVVPAAQGLSTPEVYRRFDALRPDAPAEPAPATEVLEALASGAPEALARALHNDLADAALSLRPELADLLEAGEQAGALRGLVSGSGPTCVFLCADADAARETGAGLREAGHAPLLAPGPVAGAHLVTYAATGVPRLRPEGLR